MYFCVRAWMHAIQWPQLHSRHTAVGAQSHQQLQCVVTSSACLVSQAIFSTCFSSTCYKQEYYFSGMRCVLRVCHLLFSCKTLLDDFDGPWVPPTVIRRYSTNREMRWIKKCSVGCSIVFIKQILLSQSETVKKCLHAHPLHNTHSSNKKKRKCIKVWHVPSSIKLECQYKKFAVEFLV